MKFIQTISLLAVFSANAAPATAQCVPQWSGFEPMFNTYALTTWDPDGAGPQRALLIGARGMAYQPPNPQNIQAGFYDGRSWRSLGTPFTGPTGSSHMNALAPAYTSGVGSPQPGLYAGGRYYEAGGLPAPGLAHWDGKQWHPIGTGEGIIYDLIMFDEDGQGPDEPNLFIAGGPMPGVWPFSPGILRWDGTELSELGGGLSAFRIGDGTRGVTLAIFDDDGPGPREPALYAGGSFEYAGGKLVSNIARWDGANWEPLGEGLDGQVQALAVFDPDGEGPQPEMLYAGGQFNASGSVITDSLARWDGNEWTRVGGYDGGGVESLAVFDDDGDGPSKNALIVSGYFSFLRGVPASGIARWDGTSWHGLGSGFTGFTGSHAEDMQVFDEDDDPVTPPGLYVGGVFFIAGGIVTPGLARWGCENPICYADCDESSGLGKLDIFDFLCFQQSFVTNDPYACNCDVSTGAGGGNGVCDIFDFLCFQNAFVGGCP